MTHTQEMPDSAGKFGSKQEVPEPCRYCGNEYVHVQSWESNCGGYEDYRYSCSACGRFWWVEGADS